MWAKVLNVLMFTALDSNVVGNLEDGSSNNAAQILLFLQGFHSRTLILLDGSILQNLHSLGVS